MVSLLFADDEADAGFAEALQPMPEKQSASDTAAVQKIVNVVGIDGMSFATWMNSMNLIQTRLTNIDIR
jgi:hypothetical protein